MRSRKKNPTTCSVFLQRIEWETDDEDVELPLSLLVHIEADDSDTLGEIRDKAIDYASEYTGWLINSVEKVSINW